MTRSLAIIGILIFCTSIALIIPFVLLSYQAHAIDNTKWTITAIHLSGEQEQLARLCPYLNLHNMELEKRVMKDYESQSVKITLENRCQSDTKYEVSINAPNFGISPEDRKVVLEMRQNESKDVLWIITPTKVGNFNVVTTSLAGSVTQGIVVTNWLGMDPWLIQALSSAGVILGPAATLPWWYEKMRGQKSDQSRKSKSRKAKPKRRK
jgi:hypothetical protein